MKAKAPIIRTGTDEPERAKFPLWDIINEDSRYNLNLAMKRAAKRELEVSPVIVVESPSQIARIMKERPVGAQAVI